MGFKNEMTNEELEQIAGGDLSDIPGLEAIGPYVAAGRVNENQFIGKFPGEGAQFVPI